jgi:hypothetical protein
MPAVTATQLIEDALSDLGVVGSADSIGGNDLLRGLRSLNRLLDSWRQQPHMAAYSPWLQIPIPANTASLTIGPTGADFTAARPTQLEIGGFVRVNGIDQPLFVASRDEYGSVRLKTQAGSWPTWVYYEASYPNGRLYFSEVAGVGATAFIPVRTHLADFPDLTTQVNIPDGYQSAIVPNLCLLLAGPFERQVPQWIAIAASTTKNAIKRSNYTIPELDMRGMGRMSKEAAFLAGI